MNTTMPIWISKRARLTPNRIAVIHNDNTFTFQEIEEKAKSVAQKLATNGVKKGDHIALLVKNSLQSVIFIHAAQFVGAVIVFLNNRLSPKELTWQIENSDSKVLVFDSYFLNKISELNANSKCQKISLDELEKVQNQQVELLESIDLAYTQSIMYTSGTTGNPKGVMLSYGNHWWSAVGSCLNLGLQEKDCWLATVPIFHVSGLSILMRSVIYGIAVVLEESFDPNTINDKIAKYNVTIISVVSAMLSSMVDKLDNDTYPPSLRCMLLGGGPAPLPLLERCKEKGIPVYQTYGMTETASQSVTLSSEYMLEKLGSAGKPLFPTEVEVRDEEGNCIINNPGEIVVKGPNVTKGYYKQEKQTEETIVKGWLKTGDIGYLDEEGFLYVLDRRKDLIISGGENIYPAEVESVLSAHPAIVEAAIIGQDDEKWGQVPVAFVVQKHGVNVKEKEIIDFCQKQIARYKVPKFVYFIDKLPRNASKKIVRRHLKDFLK